MRKNKIRAHCPRCRHQQLFVRAKINHLLHFTLSILTAGLWLISWVAICIGRVVRPWRCEHCAWHSPDFGMDQRPAGRMISARAERIQQRTPPIVGISSTQLQP
jgi:hypothetical protein